MAIESNLGTAPVRIRLNKLEGTRIDMEETPESVVFDVDVKMDEEGRTNEELTVSFDLKISTKPSLAQFDVAGTAVISGGRMAHEAALEVNEESNVPRVLHTIYQRVFTSLFVVSSLLETPYPPPNLIHSPAETRELGLEDQVALDAAAQQAQRAV